MFCNSEAIFMFKISMKLTVASFEPYCLNKVFQQCQVGLDLIASLHEHTA